MIAAPPITPAASADTAPARPDPLSALLSSTLPISDLAASLDLSLPDFLNLSQSPDFQSQLEAIDNLTQTRLRIHSAQARLTAIDALESLTRATQDPVERRRASSSLMRATTAATRRAPAHDEADDDEAHHRPRPRRLPCRRLRPEQVASLIARALADNDSPTPDSGLATLHTFLSRDTRAASPHLPDFIAAAHGQAGDDDAPSGTGVPPVIGRSGPMPSRAPADLPLPDLEALTDLLDTPNSATFDTPYEHGRIASVDLHLAPPSAQSPVPSAAHIRVHLTRPDTGPNRMCWLIDRITRTAPPTGPPDER